VSAAFTVSVVEDAALGEAGQPRHRPGGGVGAPALPEVAEQLFDALAGHGAARLAFDEGLSEQRGTEGGVS
jgi:hypothetical protein